MIRLMPTAVRVGLCALSLVTTLGLWLDGIAVADDRMGDPSFLLLLLVANGVLLLAAPRLPGWDRVVLAYVASGLSVVAVDLGCRLLLPSRFYYREHERFVRPLPGYPGLTHYLPNVSFEGPVSGDLAAMLGSAELAVPRVTVFRTDDLGFRNGPDRTAHPVDLLIVGDSFTVGVGTTQPATWVEQLRADTGVSLYNLSMPGGPWQHLIETRIFLARIPLRRGGRLLLCLYAGNDLDDYYGLQLEPAELRFASSWEELLHRIGFAQRRNLIRKALAAPTELRQRVFIGKVGNREGILFYRPNLDVALRSEAEVTEHPNARALFATLDSFLQLAASHPFGLEIVLFPSKEEVYAWALEPGLSRTIAKRRGLARVLAAYCASHSVPFLDLTSAFVAEATRLFVSEGDLLWWPDDSHPNERGHRFAATKIGEFVGRSRPPAEGRP
jgi:hypothetical protein